MIICSLVRRMMVIMAFAGTLVIGSTPTLAFPLPEPPGGVAKEDLLSLLLSRFMILGGIAAAGSSVFASSQDAPKIVTNSLLIGGLATSVGGFVWQYAIVSRPRTNDQISIGLTDQHPSLVWTKDF